VINEHRASAGAPFAVNECKRIQQPRYFGFNRGSSVEMHFEFKAARPKVHCTVLLRDGIFSTPGGTSASNLFLTSAMVLDR